MKAKDRRRKPTVKAQGKAKRQTTTTKKPVKQCPTLLDDVQRVIVSLPVLPA